MQVLARLFVALRVLWGLLLYDALPAALAWAVHTAERLDLLAAVVAPALQDRLGRLGLFLSAVAAIIATESLTRLVLVPRARFFGIAYFILTVAGIGLAMFPFLADWHQIPLGLTPAQHALLLDYCYLALKVGLGILIGATLSWILRARTEEIPLPAPGFTRK